MRASSAGFTLCPLLAELRHSHRTSRPMRPQPTMARRRLLRELYACKPSAEGPSQRISHFRTPLTVQDGGRSK